VRTLPETGIIINKKEKERKNSLPFINTFLRLLVTKQTVPTERERETAAGR
jgi:hypothetical protein